LRFLVNRLSLVIALRGLKGLKVATQTKGQDKT